MGGIVSIRHQGGFLPALARWLRAQPRLPETIWLPTRPAVQSLRDLMGREGLHVLPTMRTLAWDPDLDGPLPGLKPAPAAVEEAAWIEATEAHWPRLAPATLILQAQANRRLATQLMLTGCTTEIFETHLATAGEDFDGMPGTARLRQAWAQTQDTLAREGYKTAASARVAAQLLLTERMAGDRHTQVMAGFSELTGCEKPLVQACLARADGQLVLAGDAGAALLRELIADLGWNGPVEETVDSTPRASRVRGIAAPRPLAEARAVSRSIRQGWAEGLRELAVVCPDDTFRQRIAAQLRRDGVEVMVETSLLATPAGQLASRLALAAAQPEPVTLAALGSLPAVADFTDWAALDRLLWRGVAADTWEEWHRKALLLLPPEHAHGVATMVEHVAGVFSDIPAHGLAVTAWQAWLGGALETMAPAWRTLHGAQQLDAWLVELDAAPARLTMTPATWGLWVQQQLATRTLTVRDGGHDGAPHVEVLAPAAARLRAFGMVVLAGCNEGIWPGNGRANDLTTAQRQSMGLPDTLQQARILGHDWQTFLTAAPEVVLCRSLSDTGTPTVASRWWDSTAMTAAPELAREDDGAATAPKALGAWTPLGDLWPERWSATWIRRLMGCPYRAVGEGLLRLDALEDYGGVPDKATTGTLVHRWVEAFWKQVPGWPPAWNGPLTSADAPAAVAQMQEIIGHGLQEEPELVRRLWAPRINPLSRALVAGWIADGETGRTPEMLEHMLEAPMAGITVRSRADRVDMDGTGAHIVIDYKTGSVPSAKDMDSGREPQLAVEGWLLRQTGRALGHAEYWRLKGYGGDALERSEVTPEKFAGQVAAFAEHLPNVVGSFGRDALFPATPEPDGICGSCNLSGLCRRRESQA